MVKRLPVVDCAQRLRVLADDTRLAVLRKLLSGPHSVAELNVDLHLEPSLLSHHLRTLREARLVEARRQGKSVRYALAPGVKFSATGAGLDLGCCRLTFEVDHR